MRRVCVVGNSGAGKTTLARGLAAALAVPHVELDGVFHQAGWTQLPDEEFARRVQAATAGPGWVTDGNYTRVRSVLWTRADTVVWVDPPRAVLMVQLLGRTLSRMAGGRELWNGNRERWGNLRRWDPEQNILRWAWVHFAANRARYAAARTDPRWQRLRFVRVTNRRQARDLVATATRGP